MNTTTKRATYVVLDLDLNCTVNSDGTLWHEYDREGNWQSGWEMNFAHFNSRAEALAFAQAHRISEPRFKRFQIMTCNQYLAM